MDLMIHLQRSSLCLSRLPSETASAHIHTTVRFTLWFRSHIRRCRIYSFHRRLTKREWNRNMYVPQRSTRAVLNYLLLSLAWTLSYLIIEQFTRGLNRSQRLPRSRLSILLSAATAATATLYGTEHFILQDDDGPDEPSS